ncbi:hypothetical protein SCE1572_12595 [Sorangium cellulosum So0157-2]|uniref:Uncharacterized protein n=1 Tax=Sorangium cellulosum So0157-2 TaxID=1254432 RepID=S4XRY8_SORCE|nr:hypothetical protein SCE1572_12595 [Sorangium cellulosum So0157-2]
MDVIANVRVYSRFDGVFARWPQTADVQHGARRGATAGVCDWSWRTADAMPGAFELTEALRGGLTARLDHGAERDRPVGLDVSSDTWPSWVAQMPVSSGPDAGFARLSGPSPLDRLRVEFQFSRRALDRLRVEFQFKPPVARDLTI